MIQHDTLVPEMPLQDASDAVPPPECHVVDLLVETMASGAWTAFEDEEAIAVKAKRRFSWPTIRLQPRMTRIAALTVAAFAVGAAQTIWIVHRVPAEAGRPTSTPAHVAKGSTLPSQRAAVPPVTIEARHVTPPVTPAVERAPVSGLAVLESAPVDRAIVWKAPLGAVAAMDAPKSSEAPKESMVFLRTQPPIVQPAHSVAAQPAGSSTAIKSSVVAETQVPLTRQPAIVAVAPAPAPLPEAPGAGSLPSVPVDLPRVAPTVVSGNVATVRLPPPPTDIEPDDTHDIELTLGRYKQAYNALDVVATSQVWPSVERRSLARAFATLKSQSVAFSSCDVRVQGTTAVARCDGTVQFIRAVGNSDPRIERQQWTFQLRKHVDRWRIDDVVASPLGSAARAVVDTAPGSELMRQNASLAASGPSAQRQ